MTQASRAPRTRRSTKAETAAVPTTPEPAKAAEVTPPKPRAPRRAKAASAPVATPPPAASQVVDLRATTGVEEQIAVTAYLMWEQGQPGDADQHWYAAERLVRV